MSWHVLWAHTEPAQITSLELTRYLSLDILDILFSDKVANNIGQGKLLPYIFNVSSSDRNYIFLTFNFSLQISWEDSVGNVESLSVVIDSIQVVSISFW